MAAESFIASAGTGFAGQVAVITGGLGDIGSAIVRALSGHGVQVAVADVPDGAQGAAAARAAGAFSYHQVDVADPVAVQEWIDDVVRELGVPGIAVPAAATVTAAEPHLMTAAQWNGEIGVDLTGAFFTATSVIRRLLESHRPGRIVFVGSWAADRPHPHVPAYAAAKAGLRGLMRSLAVRYAPDGILINEVAPGLVDAGLSRQIFDADPELRARSSAAVPGGAMLTADDVAREVVRLCDPGLRHIVGSTVLMDGGISLVTPLQRAPAPPPTGARPDLS